MRLCSRLSSLLLLWMLVSCARPYRKAVWTPVPAGQSALALQPVLTRDLYRCKVDGRFLWKKFHLSGLLLIRKIEDAHTRAVFSNEMGFTFFDFEWDEHDSFWVNQVIPQLDKPAVIRTLQKDFSLLFMKGLDPATEVRAAASPPIHRFTLDKGYAYYTGNKEVNRIENAGKSIVTTIQLQGRSSVAGLPDTISIRHHKAHFTIDLAKIKEHADE